MDRFIDLDMQQYSYTAMHLKSNMDRFIGLIRAIASATFSI